jgi:sec-independent protein translocase protein TatA
MGLENPLHIAVLVVLLLLVFGAKRLPEIGRSLGSGMREFKDSISGEPKQPALNAADRSRETLASGEHPRFGQQPQPQPAAQPPAFAQQPTAQPPQPSAQQPVTPPAAQPVPTEAPATPPEAPTETQQS